MSKVLKSFSISKDELDQVPNPRTIQHSGQSPKGSTSFKEFTHNYNIAVFDNKDSTQNYLEIPKSSMIADIET